MTGVTFQQEFYLLFEEETGKQIFANSDKWCDEGSARFGWSWMSFLKWCLSPDQKDGSQLPKGYAGWTVVPDGGKNVCRHLDKIPGTRTGPVQAKQGEHLGQCYGGSIQRQAETRHRLRSYLFWELCWISKLHVYQMVHIHCKQNRLGKGRANIA